MAVDYKDSGVDVDAGDDLVQWLQASAPKQGPHHERILAGIGGFAAIFRGDFPQLKEPHLVACTDGVGTKVKLAAEFGSYREVAQDLVAMCLNDLICSGARPLFFLDYYAAGKLDPKASREFLAAVREACHACDTALIGGETAEMPGVYQAGDFDCAGFAVGVVDKSEILGAPRVQVGDVILGINSSGFHSNGFSLLRRLFAADATRWREALLTPTALYVRLGLALKSAGGMRALAHITGGGMENLPRVLPHGTFAVLEPWRLPQIFQEVRRRSQLSLKELVSTLNCGIGLVAIVQPERAEALSQIVAAEGFRVVTRGRVEKAHESQPESYWTVDWREFENLQAGRES